MTTTTAYCPYCDATQAGCSINQTFAGRHCCPMCRSEHEEQSDEN